MYICVCASMNICVVVGMPFHNVIVEKKIWLKNARDLTLCSGKESGGRVQMKEHIGKGKREGV